MQLSLGWRIGLTAFAINTFYMAGYIGNPMSLSMLDLTVSMVDRGKLEIDPYAGNSSDVAYAQGHYYSGMPPGESILEVPYYAAAKLWLPLVSTPARERWSDDAALHAGVAWRPSEKRFSLVLLGAFVDVCGASVLAGVMAVLFHRALGILHSNLNSRRRLVTTWLFSFATLWFIHSPTMEHRVISATLCFSSFLGFMHPAGGEAVPPGRGAGYLCGLALGYAVATSYDMVLVAACVAVFGLTERGRHWHWLWTAAGAVTALGPLAVYHTVCFGAPWSTPYGHRAFPENAPTAFQTPLWRATKLDAADELGRAVKLLVGSSYGLFFFSPPLLLALPALGRLRPGDPLCRPAALAFGMTGVLLLFHFLTGYRGTPGEFGPRFLLPLIPFLMLLAPLGYAWGYRWLVPAVTAASLVVIGKGVMFGTPHIESFWADYLSMLRTYGLANYTLANLKDHFLPGLNPLIISLVHLTALAALVVTLRFVLWVDGGGDVVPIVLIHGPTDAC